MEKPSHFLSNAAHPGVWTESLTVRLARKIRVSPDSVHWSAAYSGWNRTSNDQERSLRTTPLDNTNNEARRTSFCVVTAHGPLQHSTPLIA